MDLGVKNKLYIIVGGSRGMGNAAAHALAADGANLALISRTRHEVDQAARTITNTFGTHATAHVADASSTDAAFEQTIATIIAEHGPPRGLLVTAGVAYDTTPFLEMTDQHWIDAFQDVLMCHVRASRAVIPAMIAAGGGQIVTTAAYSSRAPKSFLFGYADQKAAIVNLTKNLAKTFGANGIRANCVCPGAFETRVVSDAISTIMTEKNIPREAAAAELIADIYKMPVALCRPGLPQEAGELMAFLLSERAAYLTGATINIDGGTDF